MRCRRADVEAYVRSTAPLLGLHLAPELLAGVVDNLERLLEQAELVVGFPVDERVEPAPIFRA